MRNYRTLNLILKRSGDIVLAGLGTVLLSPLLLTIAAAIKATSRGPVIFRQMRLGKDGTEFAILKFRTMVQNAEQIGDGLFVKTESDSRITGVGKVLRATSLDELPQLLNVISGNMSLVGPRPPVPHHPYRYEDYSEFQKKRFAMRPGITGLAQVTVRNAVPWDERIPLDVQYVETFNILLDAKILVRTVLKVFARESIYLTGKK